MKKLLLELMRKKIIACFVISGVIIVGVSTALLAANSGNATPAIDPGFPVTQKPDTEPYVSMAVPEALPEGDNGLARRYPGDAGLREDSAVVMFDDFSDYTGLGTEGASQHINQTGVRRWNFYGPSPYIDTTDPISGTQCLRMTLPTTNIEVSGEIWQWLDSNAAKGILGPPGGASSDGTDSSPFIEDAKLKAGGYEQLFVRLYMKFGGNYNIGGSNHNGPAFSGNYYQRSVGAGSKVGTQSDGFTHLLATTEFWRDTGSPVAPPGEINNYYYGAGQSWYYGDHFFPTGRVLGNGPVLGRNHGPWFVEREEFVPKLGEWNCYELMVKLNTVTTDGVRGQNLGECLNDGRMTMWVNGKIISDYPNLLQRYIKDLKLDRFGIYLHCRQNDGEQTYVWYDNIVVATEYIGPVYNNN